MGLEVLALDELHGVGSHHREADASGERGRGLHQRLILFRVHALQLDIERAGKVPRPLRGERVRNGDVALQQCLPDIAVLRA